MNAVKHHRWYKVSFWLLCGLFRPVMRQVLGFQCRRWRGPNRASLIVANHATILDPVLVALCLTRQVYFVASEHVLRKGLLSAIIRFVTAPISINKMRTDPAALMEVVRRLEAGSSVVMFAEGNRTYNGATGPVSPTVARLAKAAGADLITVRLEGGYFTTPRWAASVRKGRMTGQGVAQYSAAALRAMTAQEVLAVIERDTHEDAYQRQQAGPVRFKGKNLAQDIEIALFLCPGCQAIGTIRSQADRFWCPCGLAGRYTETGMLQGEGLAYATIRDWDAWQIAQLPGLVAAAGDGPICQDEDQDLFAIKPHVGSTQVARGPLSISRGELSCAGLVVPLGQVARIAVVDRMTLQFGLADGRQYEVLSERPRSADKYIEIHRILRRRPPRVPTPAPPPGPTPGGG
jgi:1-acyl-sn-glycerol-3-phosphate acyltransferase